MSMRYSTQKLLYPEARSLGISGKPIPIASCHLDPVGSNLTAPAIDETGECLCFDRIQTGGDMLPRSRTNPKAVEAALCHLLEQGN